MSGSDVANVSDPHEGSAVAPSPAQEAIKALRAAETRALHLVASAARRVMTVPAMDLRNPSLGAAVAEAIDLEALRIRTELAKERLMLARLEALDAPDGPVLRLFCNMAEASRRRIKELLELGLDHHRAFALVRAAGPLLDRDADAQVFVLAVRTE